MDATTLSSHSSAGYLRRFALFDYAFRPFFLLAGVYALVSVPLWLWVYAQGVTPISGLAPQFWHGHEMIYGFVAAAIAGFLLTAVPSWTGARGFGGRPLIFLTVLWMAGRIAFFAGDRLPFWIVAALELSFLPAVAMMLAPPLLRARNRNTPMLFLVGVLWLIDAAFIAGANHADAVLAQQALHLAINLVLVLITVIGGRIVPAFTASALRSRGEPVAIAARPWLDRAVIGLMIAVALVDAVASSSLAAGGLAAIAAVAHAFRLATWHGHKTVREPIVWALHIGYAWLPIGFALKALWLLGGVPWSALWLHAFAMGAFATMILAVMTRASLGHTGRPLVVSRAIAAAYLILTAGVIVRVSALAIPPDAYRHALALAGALWCAAFALYLFVYAPILWRPRVDGKPG